MSNEPYYADDAVTLYHGDCRDVTAWRGADVLVTDPPYGIGWARVDLNTRKGRARSTDAHPGIQGDQDTTARDLTLALWSPKPALVFGSFYAPFPVDLRQVLVYQKGSAAGVLYSFWGWRRDAEPVFVVGEWPKRPVVRSSVIRTAASGVGSYGVAGRTGHPHAKPGDVMAQLLLACPPGVIADPFAGSGSTLVAASLAGRRAIGVELDERYCETAARRLSQGALNFDGTT